MLHSRWLFILVLAGLGVVLNIAVAWLCAAFIAAERSGTIVMNPPGGGTNVYVEVTTIGLGHSRINRATMSELNLDTATNDILMARWSGDGTEISEDQAGWPMRSLRSFNTSEIRIDLGKSSMSVMRSGMNPIKNGFELSPRTGSARGAAWRALPYQPMWTGFIADTLLWALFAWFAIFGLAAWRRRRRRKLGLCEYCGYNLTGAPHDKCPECGTATPIRPIQT